MADLPPPGSRTVQMDGLLGLVLRLVHVPSARLGRNVSVWIRQRPLDTPTGSLLATGQIEMDDETGEEVPIFEYRPQRDGTHTPIGHLLGYDPHIDTPFPEGEGDE